MKEIQIKTLTKQFVLENIDTIININSQNKNEYWESSNFLAPLPHKFDWSLIATYDGNILGFLIASQKEKICHVHKMAVSIKFRRQGIATRLMKELIQNLKKNNISTVSLYVEDENKEANAFYKSFQYKPISSKQDSITHKTLLLLCKEI